MVGYGYFLESPNQNGLKTIQPECWTWGTLQVVSNLGNSVEIRGDASQGGAVKVETTDLARDFDLSLPRPSSNVKSFMHRINN